MKKIKKTVEYIYETVIFYGCLANDFVEFITFDILDIPKSIALGIIIAIICSVIR